MRSRSFFTVCAIFAFFIFSSIAVSGQSMVNVRFRAGANSGTYNGSIKGARYVDYLVQAHKHQRMTIKLTKSSGEPPYLNVLRKGSEVAIADDAREVTGWSGYIQDTGTYAIRVFIAKAGRLANRTSNFRISITITDGARSGGSASTSKTVYYDCDSSRLRADFKEENVPVVRIRFGTQDITLPLEPSEIGSKYEFNNQMFWVIGDTATLESKVYNSTCKAIK